MYKRSFYECCITYSNRNDKHLRVTPGVLMMRKENMNMSIVKQKEYKLPTNGHGILCQTQTSTQMGREAVEAQHQEEKSNK